MKVKNEDVRIMKVEISGVEHTEAEGFMASARLKLEIPLEDQRSIVDSKLKNAIHQVLTVGRAKTKEQQKNTFTITAKEDFGLVEHTFTAPDVKSEVVTVGTMKQVTYRVVEGELSVRYNLDAVIPLTNIARLVAYMDAACKLTTLSAQTNLFEFPDEEAA